MVLVLLTDTVLRTVASRLLRAHVVRLFTARVLVPGLLALNRFAYTRADARHGI